MMPLWLLFLLVGAAGGFTAGLFGVGGGLVIVPTLYLLWRGDPVLGPEVMHFAVATSLACIVITSVTSSWTHWRARRLQFDRLYWLAGSVSLGSVSAVLLANWVPTQWLKLGFGMFALTTCVTLLGKRPCDGFTDATAGSSDQYIAGSFHGGPVEVALMRNLRESRPRGCHMKQPRKQPVRRISRALLWRKRRDSNPR